MSENHVERIEALQRELDELRAAVVAPAATDGHSAGSTEVVPPDATEIVAPAGSRRNLLKLAAGAAAGAWPSQLRR